ncbi:MAG: hypothetical protein EAZ95_16745 [Bacteroidetes bacterium]|nr:MAG: hypothetical protein EAZ95_16745 [Bacteroidota bacterium]
MQEQSIPCPVCQTKIPFDVHALLRGVAFTCPSCFASIGIAQEALPTVNDAMQKLEELKKNIHSAKKSSS